MHKGVSQNTQACQHHCQRVSDIGGVQEAACLTAQNTNAEAASSEGCKAYSLLNSSNVVDSLAMMLQLTAQNAE